MTLKKIISILSVSVMISTSACVAMAFTDYPKNKYVHPESNVVNVKLKAPEVPDRTPTVTSQVVSSSGCTISDLKNLSVGNLKDYIQVFYQAEYKTGINAVYLLAIACVESGYGTSDLANTHNNLFGLRSGNDYLYFNTKKECIYYTAELLKNKYLNPDGEYFNGSSIHGVAIRYCETPEWPDVVYSVYLKLMEEVYV